MQSPPLKSRFLILGLYMAAMFAEQVQWLSHAAVSLQGAEFYAAQLAGSEVFSVDFLALVYMVVFLLLSFPASYVIDSWGLGVGLRIGGALLAVFSLLKAFWVDSFWGLLAAQVGLAIAQPFLLNAITALSVHWFPPRDRGLAAGLAVFAQYLGMVAAMVVSPWVIGAADSLSQGFTTLGWLYGSIGAITGIALLLGYPRNMAHDASEAVESGITFAAGLKLMVHNRSMIALLVLFTVGLGIINAISSLVDVLAHKIGLVDAGGTLGGLMLIGGIFGSLIMPVLSDHFGRRKPFIVVAALAMMPALIGFFEISPMVTDPGTRLWLAAISSFALGFFVMGIGPVGFQYAAEITAPAPESASQGMLLWIGQISGIAFVVLMTLDNSAYLGGMLLSFYGLAGLAIAAALLLKEVTFSSND